MSCVYIATSTIGVPNHNYSSGHQGLCVGQLIMNVTSQSTVLEPLKKYVCDIYLECVYNCIYLHLCDMRLCKLLQCPDDRSQQDGADCANSQVNSNSF